MKTVAVFPGTREVTVVERDAPRITQPAKSCLRMLDIGICGTDRDLLLRVRDAPPGDDFW